MRKEIIFADALSPTPPEISDIAILAVPNLLAHPRCTEASILGSDHIQNEVRIGLIWHLDGAIAAGTRIDSCAAPGSTRGESRLDPAEQHCRPSLVSRSARHPRQRCWRTRPRRR